MADIELLRRLHEQVGAAIEAHASGRQGAKQEIVKSIDKLRKAAEPPVDTLVRQPYHTVQNLALMIAIRMGLLSFLVQHEGKVVSAKDIASANDFDELFVARMMRMVTATGFADEVGYRQYRSNAVTMLHEVDGMNGAWLYTHEWFLGLDSKIDEFVKQMKGRSSDDAVIFFDLLNQMSIWKYLQDRPEQSVTFNKNMKLRGDWYAVPWHIKFPLEDQVSKVDPVIVDVGGNVGSDLIRVVRDFPDFKGRLILQDRPVVLGQIAEESIPKRIERMPHDFFAPQPVKGADIYHIRGCLHNWRDGQVIQIVSHLAEAMSSSSRLLINDLVLADTDETAVNRVDMDIEMLFVNGSVERDLTHWKELITRVTPKLNIAKLWHSPGDDQSIIELRRSQD